MHAITSIGLVFMHQSIHAIYNQSHASHWVIHRSKAVAAAAVTLRSHPSSCPFKAHTNDRIKIKDHKLFAFNDRLLSSFFLRPFHFLLRQRTGSHLSLDPSNTCFPCLFPSISLSSNIHQQRRKELHPPALASICSILAAVGPIDISHTKRQRRRPPVAFCGVWLQVDVHPSHNRDGRKDDSAPHNGRSVEPVELHQLLKYIPICACGCACEHQGHTRRQSGTHPHTHIHLPPHTNTHTQCTHMQPPPSPPSSSSSSSLPHTQSPRRTAHIHTRDMCV